MKTGKASVFHRASCILGEGPCYDARSREWNWVDIKTGTLYILKPDGSQKMLQTGQYLGAAIPTQNGRYIAAMATGIYLLSEDAVEKRLCIPPDMSIYQRFNDAKCDPQGRLFAGTMPLFSKYADCGGRLYRYDGATAQPLPFWLGVPNGMAWSLDGKTMYLVDTAAHTIYAFDYDLASGTPVNQRIAVQVVDGFPDGMSMDVDGNLWVAVWGAGEVRCYQPNTGSLLETVQVDAKYVSSCCFGGEDLRTLLITTAAEDDFESPNAGCLFAYRTDVAGTLTNLFNDANLSLTF